MSFKDKYFEYPILKQSRLKIFASISIAISVWGLIAIRIKEAYISLWNIFEILSKKNLPKILDLNHFDMTAPGLSIGFLGLFLYFLPGVFALTKSYKMVRFVERRIRKPSYILLIIGVFCTPFSRPLLKGYFFCKKKSLLIKKDNKSTWVLDTKLCSKYSFE